MKLNKKYFLAIFTALVIQAYFGVNLASAVPCENEIVDAYTNEVSDGYRQNPYTYFGDNSKINQDRYDMKSISKADFIKLIAESAKVTGVYGPPPVNPYRDNAFTQYKGNSCVERHNIISQLATSSLQPESSGRVYPITGFKGDKLLQCVSKYMSQNNCDISAFLGGSSKQSNSSSSSGTSKQSKSSQKTTNNQPKQSSSTDLSKLSTDELINFINDAKKRGDQAQAYAGEMQLTKDPHPEISRQANRSVGFRLREGLGVDKNLPESLKYLSQAANLGDITAYGMLCDNFIRGVGVPENHKKAIEYCQVAAENNDVVSQANLGWLYRNSNQVPQNLVLSDQWTCKAASQGEQTAVNNVKKNSINCN